MYSSTDQRGQRALRFGPIAEESRNSGKVSATPSTPIVAETQRAE